jgi:hypothetical protein
VHRGAVAPPEGAIERIRSNRERRYSCFALVLAFILALGAAGEAAEANTGSLAGSVADASGRPLQNARISAASPSGKYSATSDAGGRFAILGIVPDSYVVSAEAGGYEPGTQAGVAVFSGQQQSIAFRLVATLKTIGTVRTTAKNFNVGSTSDSFSVSGSSARALAPSENASGLANYAAGTVQGAIAGVPGVDLDTFANAVLRGGKVDDAIFNYDSVPIPQGLIAEPGGNIVGAQLFTTGVGSTSVTLAGFRAEGDNALGGIINQIPAIGTYPGTTTVDIATGAPSQFQQAAFASRWATPDLRWRYALAATFGNEYFGYGDGSTFYPSEAATYGLSLQTRGQSSAAANVHFQPSRNDDVALVGFYGQAAYQQYASPFAGETVGQFNGENTVYPGSTDPSAPVNYASGLRGNYSVVKGQWLHSGPRSLTRLQVYQTQYGSQAGGPFWDDLSFPDGAVSLSSVQGSKEYGATLDVHNIAVDRNDLQYGLTYRTNSSFLYQVVPTADEFINSNPTTHSYLAYFGDTWSAARRLDLSGTLRWSQTHIAPSFGAAYDVGALDPHLAAAYRVGDAYALRATYDKNTVAPKPLEADRTDSVNPAPFVPLAPEQAKNFTLSFEGGGRTPFRATYYIERQSNRIDVLPVNFRSAVNAGQNPSGVGVPTNAGDLHAQGFEFWAKRGGLTLNTNYIRGFSSSASQFSYNSLNAAAVAAGHLFPIGYVPDFSAMLSYEIDAMRGRLRITPGLSYQTGYPYGNGKKVYVFDPVTNRPELVPNDNHVNPGYSYYFLRDPSQPFDASSNPYVGNLGTPEGDDPNTLRSVPQTLVSLHVEADLSKRATAILDFANLLSVTTPTALQGNPYLIGPPGYAGGDPLYAAAYQQAAGFSQPYVLGNGVPTNDGVQQSLPWTYGRGGYVPQGYPLAFTMQLRLRYRF